MTETVEMQQNLLNLTADIVAAHVAHNRVPLTSVPTLIQNVHRALCSLGARPEALPVEPPTPAVSPRASVKPDHLVCLFDGKKMKVLKRHVRTYHDMSPEEYRTHWGLPAAYPMVASSYALRRRDLALKIGLGRKSSVPAKGSDA